MREHIQRLHDALNEWLIKNDLHGHSRFYSPEEWRLRDEAVHNNASLILVFEGNLHTFINHTGDTFEIDDFVESFGFFYELGHSWNVGFYPIDGYNFQTTPSSYKEKLQDKRWKEKSRLVKTRADNKCQDCGNSTHLEAHHCYYNYGYEPWEYPLGALRCLCRLCHEKRGKSEIRMIAYLAKLTSNQIDELRNGLTHALDFFESDAVIELLSSIGRDDKKIYRALEILLENKINRQPKLLY